MVNMQEFIAQIDNSGATDLLLDLREEGVEDAIIAGGFIRDILNGKPVKDIDIFCSRKYSHIVSELSGVEDDNACKYQNIPDVDHVWNLFSLDSEQLPVQIIAMEGEMSPIERISTFDFGICQCWFDGEQILYTNAFYQDYLNKTMTLVYCENQHEWDRSIRRAERLQKKYDDFKLVANPRDSYPARPIVIAKQVVQMSRTDREALDKRLIAEMFAEGLIGS